MTHHWTSTERLATEAKTKIIGKFCSRCRSHRPVEGGALLQAANNRKRWVCAPCLLIIKRHKQTVLPKKD